MGTRAVRKLEQQMKASSGAADDDDESGQDDAVGPVASNAFGLLEEEEEEEDDDDGSQQVTVNPFEMLDEDDEVAGEEEFNEPDGEEEGSFQVNEVDSGNKGNSSRQGSKAGKKKSKKKKKAKKESRKTDPERTDGEVVWTDEEGEEFQAELMQIMDEIQAMVDESEGGGSDRLDFMRVSEKKLRPENELRRLFGSRVSAGERSARTGQPHQGGRPLGRNMLLVTPRDTWVLSAPGLSMSEVKTRASESDGARWFRYEHSAEYSALQEQYAQLAQTHDPNALVHLLNRNPYHVDSLLQLAEANREMGELDRAAEFIERAIYLLERAWAYTFKPFDGFCRLSYKHSKNRSLFIALFRYAQILSRRGLNRTAFEVAKLLYNLDPQCDPIGSTLLIDSLALLTREREKSQWLLDVFENFSKVNVQWLPNFNFSAAYAAKTLELEYANDILQKAIARFPMAVAPFLRIVGDNSGFQYHHAIFSAEPSAVEQVFVRITLVYAQRSKALWTPEHIEWFKQQADEVAKSGLAEDFADDRKGALNMLENHGLYQHVHMSDYSDSATSTPSELTNVPVGIRPVHAASAPGMVMHFFTSLLPWYGASNLAASVADPRNFEEQLAELYQLYQMIGRPGQVHDEEGEAHQHAD